jgi:hypothetical protein
MVIAGLRFDTRGDPLGVSGPRWKMAAPEARILPRFAARPLGRERLSIILRMDGYIRVSRVGGPKLSLLHQPAAAKGRDRGLGYVLVDYGQSAKEFKRLLALRKAGMTGPTTGPLIGRRESP